MKTLCISCAVALSASTALACSDQSGLLLTANDEAAPVAFVTDITPSASAPFDVTLTLCGTASAEVTFDAIMPAHQHGMNYAVDVRQVTEGTFHMENIVFHMPGLWELQFDVKIGEARYSYRGEMMVP